MGLIVAVIAVVAVAGYFVLVKKSPEPVAPPSSSTVPSKPAGGSTSMSEPKTYAVAIQNFAFDQKSLVVKKGDTIVWTNKDSAPHTVTEDTGSQAGGPSSQTLNSNGTYRFVFNSAGTFKYHCEFHPSMKATVIVE